MNELTYDCKHFSSGTYRGKVTAAKVSVSIFATLHFDIENKQITGDIETQDLGKVDISGTFNPTAPYDFKITMADTVYNGFRKDSNLIGRCKGPQGKGVFELKPHNLIAPAKLAEEKDMTEEETISELINMGFDEERVREAIVLKGLSLSEAAEALVQPRPGKMDPEELVIKLSAMFPEDKVRIAVEASDGDEEVALSILLEDTTE